MSSGGSVTHWIHETRAGNLDEPQLQKLAIGKMEGFTNEEMAEQLGCSLRMAKMKANPSLDAIRDKDTLFGSFCVSLCFSWPS